MPEGLGSDSPAAWRETIQLRKALLDEARLILLQVLDDERDLDALDPDAPLFGSGHGLDSIDVLDLVVSIEARFDLPELVPNASALQGARTLRTLNSLVDRLVEAGARP